MIYECLYAVNTKLDETQVPRGETPGRTKAYPLTEGKEYVIAAMMIREHQLKFLLKDDNSNVRWKSAALFRPKVADIPEHWIFRLGSGLNLSGPELWEDPLGAIWGYPTIVNVRTHADDVILGKREALTIVEQELRLGSRDQTTG